MTVFAKIRPLTEKRGEAVDKMFKRLAERLGEVDREGTFSFTILGADSLVQRSFMVKEGRCTIAKESVTSDLEIITRQETWQYIADGVLSPLDAFTQGKLRVRGNTELGSFLLGRLSNGEGETSICGG